MWARKAGTRWATRYHDGLKNDWPTLPAYGSQDHAMKRSQSRSSWVQIQSN